MVIITEKYLVGSGAGMNLKVGRHVRHKKRRKFFCHALTLFLALQVLLVNFVNTFMVASLLFVCSSTRGPPCAAICKSGGTCPPPKCCMESSATLLAGTADSSVFFTKITAICSCGHRLYVLTVVPRSTQSSTLSGTVNEYQPHG